MNRDLNVAPEDFPRAMAAIARPDDLDHGTTGATARRTRTGRSAPPVVVTGESDLPDGRVARPQRRRPPRRRVAALDATRDAVDAEATPARTGGTWRVAA